MRIPLLAVSLTLCSLTLPAQETGAPTEYIQPEFGIRFTPEDASDPQDLKYGLEPYVTSRGKLVPAFLVDFHNKITANGTRTLPKPEGHFIVNPWNAWEPTLGNFSAPNKQQLLNYIAYEKSIGGKILLVPIAKRDNNSTRAQFITDEQCARYKDGTIAMTDNVSVGMHYEYAVTALTTPGGLNDLTNPAVKYFRFCKEVCKTAKQGWKDGVVTAVCLALNTTNEAGYNLRFADLPGTNDPDITKPLLTDYHEVVRQGFVNYYSFLPADTQLPYNSTSPYTTFRTEIGMLFAHYRTRTLAHMIAIPAVAAYEVMPGIPLMIDFGQIEGSEAGFTAEVDAQELARYVREILQAHFPNTTIRLRMKLNPYPKADHTYLGQFLSGLMLTHSDTDIWQCMDQDFIQNHVVNGETLIAGLDFNEHAARAVEYQKAAGGNVSVFQHGVTGSNVWPYALNHANAYISTANRTANAKVGPPQARVWHSPEEYCYDPKSYAGLLKTRFNTASVNRTLRVAFPRAPRFRKIETKTESGLKKIRVTADYPVLGDGAVAYWNGSVWTTLTQSESEYVATATVPSSRTSVQIRPVNNPRQLWTVSLNNLQANWETRYYLDKPIIDSDGDGRPDMWEGVFGSDPNNPASTYSAQVTLNASGKPVITWPSVNGRSYRVEHTNTPGGTWQTLSTINATSPASSHTDTTTPTPSGRIYRVVAM